jgi:hypothetical protein
LNVAVVADVAAFHHNRAHKKGTCGITRIMKNALTCCCVSSATIHGAGDERVYGWHDERNKSDLLANKAMKNSTKQHQNSTKTAPKQHQNSIKTASVHYNRHGGRSEWENEGGNKGALHQSQRVGRNVRGDEVDEPRIKAIYEPSARVRV